MSYPKVNLSEAECDLCEETVFEWVWVDDGWSLACVPCLRKAAHALLVYEGKTTNLLAAPPAAPPA
jgi:hypothetical protein